MKTHKKKNLFLACLFPIIVFSQIIACVGTDNLFIVPVITSANHTVFLEGEAGTFTFTATGLPTPSFTVTGLLPSGVTFNASTGVLSGTPAAGTSGAYPLTITANNGHSSTQSFTLAVLTASTAALIVHDGTAGIEANVVSNLSSIMTAAGLTVTTSVGIPAGSLLGYVQIWDVRFNNTTPLSFSEIMSYTSYISTGRTLIVIGENTGFNIRNDSIVDLIGNAGGGSITVTSAAGLQTVYWPFTGPNTVSTVTFLASAGTDNPGAGAFITKDAANIGTGLYYAENTLSNAPAGRLMVVFDVNFLDIGAGVDFQNLITNMIKLP